MSVDIATKAEIVGHALEMLTELVKLLSDVHADKVPPDEALAKVAALHDRLMADRSAADRALAERFKGGEE